MSKMPTEKVPEKAKTSETLRRKSSKPIMEKRRRARINDSLNQLKTLILDALKKDSSRHSKLEKADILEMTVKHLRNLQRQQIADAVVRDPVALSKYRAGYSECMTEVSRFLTTSDGVDSQVQQRLLGHLASCCQTVDTLAPVQQPVHVQVAAAAPPVSVAGAISLASPTAQTSPLRVPGPAVPTTAYGGIPVVPGQIPSGEPVAVLLPSQAFPGGQMPSHVIPVYANATVVGSSRPESSAHGATTSTFVQSTTGPTVTPAPGLITAVPSLSPAAQRSPVPAAQAAPVPSDMDKMWRPW
ncbi:PREDICTED: transcription factor HES-1-like [Branchiostoma belcheri]|uniref:Transcription factor HES-1-like n=1 Tax=Branchiostoma belcheri TaxID=7741 RepID=A0A6P4ZV29_BRABE|nr:PREDICTED: transcription factor HES-1-like [Branchiostoma belcheri]XP_019637895.1 PREDICTED: transcription factor HES-1-like [Branchiostoma belcheri]